MGSQTERVRVVWKVGGLVRRGWEAARPYKVVSFGQIDELKVAECVLKVGNRFQEEWERNSVPFSAGDIARHLGYDPKIGKDEEVCRLVNPFLNGFVNQGLTRRTGEFDKDNFVLYTIVEREKLKGIVGTSKNLA